MSPSSAQLIMRQWYWQYKIQWMLFKTMLLRHSYNYIGIHTPSLTVTSNVNIDKDNNEELMFRKVSRVILVVVQSVSNMRCLQRVTIYL